MQRMLDEFVNDRPTPAPMPQQRQNAGTLEADFIIEASSVPGTKTVPTPKLHNVLNGADEECFRSDGTNNASNFFNRFSQEILMMKPNDMIATCFPYCF